MTLPQMIPQSTPVTDPESPLFARVWWMFLSSMNSAVATISGSVDALQAAPSPTRSGTHTARLALSSVPDGTIYVETDRNELVYQMQAGAWVYVSGAYTRTQAQLAALVATLTTADIGLRIYVSDYAHMLWCTAAATVAWAPEDPQNAGQICHFDVAPATGWKLIDGTGDDGSPIGVAHPIKILKADGTTRSNTTAADQTAGAYVRGEAAYAGAVTAATVPVVSQPTFTGTLTNTASANTGTAATLSGASVNVTLLAHVHSYTPIGTVSQPTATLPGDPVAHTDALPYIRK